MKHFHIFTDKDIAIGQEVPSQSICCLDNKDDVLYIHKDVGDTAIITLNLNKTYFIDYLKYLRFTAKQDGSSVTLNSVNIYNSVQNSFQNSSMNLYFSLDGKTFYSWQGDVTLSLNNNECVYVYGFNPTTWVNQNYYPHFSMTGKIEADGNIMSLIDPTCPNTIPFISAFNCMFSSNSALIKAPCLSATTLTLGCYCRMFLNCSGLTETPKLSATTLANSCYFMMFYQCYNLVKTHKLPATTLKSTCYNGMFRECVSLTKAPELPATTLASECYSWMFAGCLNLVNAPELPATELKSYCYNTMFNNCTSLTTAPELPATTLVNYCYNSMFVNCSNLNYIKAMFTTTPGTSYTDDWVSGVAASGTFIKNHKATWNVTGVTGIPEGWTVEMTESIIIPRIIKIIESDVFEFDSNGELTGNLNTEYINELEEDNKLISQESINGCTDWYDYTDTITINGIEYLHYLSEGNGVDIILTLNTAKNSFGTSLEPVNPVKVDGFLNGCDGENLVNEGDDDSANEIYNKGSFYIVGTNGTIEYD